MALAPKPAAKTGEVKRAERKEAADWVLAFVALSDSERWAAAGLPSIDAAAAFRIREVLEKGDVRADAFEDLLERDVATGVYVLKVLSKMSGVVATVSSMDSWLRVEGSSIVVSGKVDSNSSIEALF